MDLPPGLKHSLCLFITPSSLKSILDSPLPSTANRKYRKDIRFVVAVAATYPQAASPTPEDEDGADSGWRGSFNVAVETLLDCLFPLLADDSMTPFELGGHLSGDDVWCDSTRWGVYKGGVGSLESRSTLA